MNTLGCAYVYFAIFKSLLQILIDSLIRNLADQREVRNANLPLLAGFEHGFAHLGLCSSAAAAGTAWLRGASRLFRTSGALGDGLRCAQMINKGQSRLRNASPFVPLCLVPRTTLPLWNTVPLSQYTFEGSLISIDGSCRCKKSEDSIRK